MARREIASAGTTVGRALAENVFAASAYSEAMILALRELELNEQALRLRERELELCERRQVHVERLLEKLERLAKIAPAAAREVATHPVPVRPPALPTRPAVLLAGLRDVEIAAGEHRRERERSREERAGLHAEIERVESERARMHETRDQLMRVLAAVDPALRAERASRAERDPAEA